MPKRSRAAVAEIEQSRFSGIGRAIVAHPREFVGLLLGATAATIIFSNALFMQKGSHPAPIFAARPTINVPAPVAAGPVRVQPLIGSQPAAQPLNRVQVIAEIQRELSRRGFYEGAADGIWGAKTDSGARDFGQSVGLRIDPNAPEEILRIMKSSPAATQPVSQPAPQSARRDPIAELIAPSPRVVAIQRALTDFGYGQIKPTGNFDAATRTAIEKFERDRKLPVTGQISDRFVRELSAMTGRPLE